MNHLPPLRPPPRPHTPSGHRSQSSLSQASLRSESSLSTTSNDSSQFAAPSTGRNSPFVQPPTRPSTSGGIQPSQNQSNLHTRPQPPGRVSVDGTSRTASPAMPTHPHHPGQAIGHRARQHSQGFFEPSLPHASNNASGLSASQIAAQAAMHRVSPPPPHAAANERKRSHPGLAPLNTAQPPSTARKPSDSQSPQVSSAGGGGGLHYSNGTLGGSRLAAATAANAAFPNGRSPLPSPGVVAPPYPMAPPPGLPPEKEPKTKTSKMKLFSKPTKLGLSKDREGKVAPGMPSPGKGGVLGGNSFASASSTSLLNPGGGGGGGGVGSSSAAASIYSTANASTSTLVPTTSEKEKRHHFLSRQKNKLKDESAQQQLPLSSAHSNSQPTNPEKPQPLYSFTPDSPGASTFSKSMSGFDLRHGGRALREKKKEEKAAAKMDLTPIPSGVATMGGPSDSFGPPSYDPSLAPPSSSAGMFQFPNDTMPPISAQQFTNVGASMGLTGIGPDDAWPLLKARLLNLFSGEELRTPIEDFNTLVGVHIRRCVQRQSPVILIEDLRELLQTGFSSLSQTLRGVPDDQLVPKLVAMWIGVHASILPFLQAVFLPMDLEFKGRGHILSVREAQDFWGAMPEQFKSDERPTSAGGTGIATAARVQRTLGEELDVRRITLITFRDTVVLPRHEALMAMFSRLSLHSINAAAAATATPDPTGRQHARSDPAHPGAERPGTAGSLSPHLSSFNSQGSTLLDAASSSNASSGGGGFGGSAGRSRATSATSAGSFGTNMPHLASPSLNMPSAFSSTTHTHHPPPQQSQQTEIADPAQITDTVARMLQCLYVLGSCQTGDVGQGVVERLTGALKYNWLGRGRTGRDRRGWVGMKGIAGGGGGIGGRVGLVGA